MTIHEKNNFRQMLEQLLADTSQNLGIIQERLSMTRASGADELDRGLEESSRSLLISQANRGTSLIRQIRQALELMDSGEYGICCNCGEDIHLRRLLVYPAAQFCTHCQELLEQGRLDHCHFPGDHQELEACW
ncbi:MAG: TraR/DksA family transcriptional regulator [Desulfonatronovibrionaceae bacterium]